MTIQPDWIDRINIEHWNALAAVHGNGVDQKYGVEELKSGKSSLLPQEAVALQLAAASLDGLEVVQLQCHLAFDAVSMARMGAKVTAVDFSGESLRKAEEIAAGCGVYINFVEANVMKLPSELHGKFDIAYATLGIFGWIYDVDAWMASVFESLKPGGKLVVVDFHPVMNVFKSVDPVHLWGTYHFSGPQIDDVGGSYASPTQRVAHPAKAKFSYNLAEIVGAALRVGIRLDHFDEHRDSGRSQIARVQTQDDDGLWRCRVDGVELPVLFTLIGTKELTR